MEEPNLTKVVNFLTRTKDDNFTRLTILLNDNKFTHQRIAHDIGIDRGNLSKLIKSCYDRPYILKPAVRTFVDELELQRRKEYERQRKTEAHILSLLPRSETKDCTLEKNSR